jgi:signal transduction histidine kinase/ActR/RegA family two-component response regulator
MLVPVLTVKLHSDHTLVMLRDRCRQVAELFGLERLQRTRLTTAVSEIGRNALQHGGGAVVTFLVGEARTRPGLQAVCVQVVDKGPGVPTSVWVNGTIAPERATGGLRGSQRLVDAFTLTATPGQGTVVAMEMHFPRDAAPLSLEAINARVDELVRRKPQSPREELEQQNREMLQTLEELRARQLELEQAAVRKNEFVAMLAHELRNPLSAISMAVTVLDRKQTVTQQEIKKYGASIGRQTAQLTRLIDDLMDISRLSLGKVQLEREVIDVGSVVAQAIEMTRAFIDAKHHRLTVSIPVEKIWIHADVVRMKQVISNLLHNAARYTPTGGTLEVSIAGVQGFVSVTVRDNGIGMDAATLPLIFDLFTQASNGIAREDAGLGIGLTIVKQLVQDHGGTVSASSGGVGHGSTFVVTLAAVPAPALVEEPGVAVHHQVATRRILVVDDNEDSAQSIQSLLQLSGHTCVVAHDGLQGVAAAQLARPDIAIVDLGLPLLDGFGVARELRHLHGPDLLLIAMSGYSASETRARAELEGFDEFWVKPIEIEVLLQRVAKHHNGTASRRLLS